LPLLVLVLRSTRAGFLDAHLVQSANFPYETMEELAHLGYDLHLVPSSYTRVEDALASQVRLTLGSRRASE
jgi:hypothetical protein